MSDLLSINVNDKTEKKNGLSYLSWAWAWAEVLKHDPEATWEAVEYQQPDGTVAPCMYLGNGTAMVKVSVTIKGRIRACVLPVMDHRNKAIQQPDAFAVNTAIMRCMTKAVSMHGLGLYIYAGEDLPESAVGMSADVLNDWLGVIATCKDTLLEKLVSDGLAAATEVKDREAFAAIRQAGKARQKVAA